jgi:hypothetical protein
VHSARSRGDGDGAAFVPISGTETYVHGEYLYTDHLYDDYGSDTGVPRAPGLLSQPAAGDITYRRTHAGTPADR